MAYKPQVGATMSAPNVIPMADIMLVLLIIFMVVTPMLSNGITVDMAHVPDPAALPDADKDDAIIVAVTRDGKIFIGSDQTSRDALTEKIKDKVSDRIDKTIFIRSDRRARYGDVAAVVDEVRNAGVDKVGLLTERVTGSATPPPPGD